MAEEGMPVIRTRKDSNDHSYADENFHEPQGLVIPWSHFDTKEVREQCRRNHGQTPERLRERGGLSSRESMMVLTGASLRKFDLVSAPKAAVWVTTLVRADVDYEGVF